MSETSPDQPVEAPSGFDALGLGPELLATLEQLEHHQPTPIQLAAIPEALAGHDVLGQAATGTGKTAAFALPILDRLAEPGDMPRAIVLTPTRELAIQVESAVRAYGEALALRSVAVYGGQPIQHQIRRLNRGCDIVVATPGRTVDLVQRGSLDLGGIETVVLDEADEMLDMGFAEELEAVLDATPPQRQTLLFSATMPGRIKAIANRHLSDPVHLKVERATSDGEPALVDEVAYLVRRRHKAAALARVLDHELATATLVFCRTRADVDELTLEMNARGHRAEALHGGMDQAQRDKVMGRLRDGTAQLLVATDVAARGLDVDLLTHVVNYDLPTATESYVHRIGRVGRAGRKGVAITLADPRMGYRLDQIAKATGRPIEIGSIPTADQIRARQLAQTAAAISETLAADELEEFNSVLHELAGAGSDRAIALAAIKIAHDARNRAIDETEIPDASQERPKRRNDDGKGASRAGAAGGERMGDLGSAVQINVGRSAGVRPGDLVGCIANHTSLVGAQIGPIKINDKSSVVGVPAEAIDDVIAAIATTTIRGRKAKARRYDERLAGGDRPPRPNTKHRAGGHRDGGQRDGAHRGKRPQRPRR